MQPYPLNVFVVNLALMLSQHLEVWRKGLQFFTSWTVYRKKKSNIYGLSFCSAPSVIQHSKSKVGEVAHGEHILLWMAQKENLIHHGELKNVVGGFRFRGQCGVVSLEQNQNVSTQPINHYK